MAMWFWDCELARKLNVMCKKGAVNRILVFVSYLIFSGAVTAESLYLYPEDVDTSYVGGLEKNHYLLVSVVGKVLDECKVTDLYGHDYGDLSGANCQIIIAKEIVPPIPESLKLSIDISSGNVFSIALIREGFTSEGLQKTTTMAVRNIKKIGPYLSASLLALYESDKFRDAGALASASEASVFKELQSARYFIPDDAEEPEIFHFVFGSNSSFPSLKRKGRKINLDISYGEKQVVSQVNVTP